MINENKRFVYSVHMLERVFAKFNFNRYWDLRDLMIIFPHLSIREGYVLDGYDCGDKRNAVMKLYACIRDSSNQYVPYPINTDGSKEPLIAFKDGQFVDNTIPRRASDTVPPLVNYLELDFSRIAIWEAILLLKATPLYLQHRWHGCYLNGLLVVDKVSYYMACLSYGIESNPWVNDCRLLPSVEMISDSEALVNYCYWNDWKGLSRMTVKVIRNGKGISIENNKREVLIEYHSIIKY